MGITNYSDKWDFPGDPVVKISCSQSRGKGLIPGQGTKILHVTKHGQKKKKVNDILFHFTQLEK